jgi:hypothetical protein
MLPGLLMTAAEARELIGARFLADPNFKVAINGTKVTFGDVPAGQLREIGVEVEDYGVAYLSRLPNMQFSGVEETNS